MLALKKKKSQNNLPKYELLPRNPKSVTNEANPEDHPTIVYCF